MKKFNIFAGMKSEEYNLHVLHGLEFETVTEALDYAEDYSSDLYCMNPDRDILEIMKEDKCKEEEARKKFISEMALNTISYVVEIVEINGIIHETIEHSRVKG